MSSEQDRAWESGWGAHEKAQLKRLASIPLPEKLRWLEEAHTIVGHLKEEGEKRKKEKGRSRRGR